MFVSKIDTANVVELPQLAEVAPKLPDVAHRLREVRALIKKGWLRCDLAASRAGISVSPHSESAVSFCLYGAMVRVSGSGGYRVRFDLEQAWERANRGRGLVTFNDSIAFFSKSRVLHSLDRAIALAERGGD